MKNKFAFLIFLVFNFLFSLVYPRRTSAFNKLK